MTEAEKEVAEKIKASDGSGTLFMSPSKIQKARDIAAGREGAREGADTAAQGTQSPASSYRESLEERRSWEEARGTLPLREHEKPGRLISKPKLRRRLITEGHGAVQRSRRLLSGPRVFHKG